MAIENKKLRDPAEAALSAIEAALNLNHLDPVGAEGKAPDDARATRLPDVEDHAFEGNRARRLEPDPVPEPTDRRDPVGLDRPESAFPLPERAQVANDDRQSVGLMLQALQVRPSKRAYVVAVLASLAWAGGFAALLYAQGLQTPDALRAAFTPVQIALGALALLGPILLFMIAGMLAVRSQEMKLVARAVGEVAVRLAQPEAFSTDAVLSVSQAVRREVAAVGDGVERALARAGELETLVRSEIATLERAYADNEFRIRNLVDELAAQRESIVSNAERVRSAISGSHQNLTQELETAAQRLVTAVNSAGERVTGSLEQRGEQITEALGRTGERVIEELGSPARAAISSRT
jgi:hypothetical protein